MADIGTPAGFDIKSTGQLDHEQGASDWLRFSWLLPVLATLILAVFAIVHFWRFLNGNGESFIPIGFAILLSIVLSALPAVVCTVQNVSRRRQLGKLNSLLNSPVSRTTFFKAALASIDSVRLRVDFDYALPIFFFFLLNFIGFLAVLTAYSRATLFDTASVLLGGWEDRTDASFAHYQMQTFAVVAMAFLGSYAYSLGRILDRINNNDLYPISLYYYTTRAIVACLAAAVLRHSIAVFGDATDAIGHPGISVAAGPMLLLLGFVMGFAPDLFIVAMTRRGFQAIKVWGSRSDPADDTHPTGLPLLMIDDLTREKIDRLNELEIDSAQVLARQNPFLLLPRLPFDLSLLVDWIGQAQLYCLVKEAGLAKLRARYVRDIFDFRIRLEEEAARTKICQELELPESYGKALVQQLDQDISYLRLSEVKDALRPGRTIDSGSV